MSRKWMTGTPSFKYSYISPMSGESTFLGGLVIMPFETSRDAEVEPKLGSAPPMFMKAFMSPAASNAAFLCLMLSDVSSGTIILWPDSSAILWSTGFESAIMPPSPTSPAPPSDMATGM